MAGIVGARANAYGGRGIAPEATLQTIKVFRDEEIVYNEEEGIKEIIGGGGYDEDIIRAILLAASDMDMEGNAKQKADIINMSLGGPYYNGVEDEVIASVYYSGAAVFCAAGNEYSEQFCYPAGYPKAISVAALNYSLNKTDFSNWGSKIRYSAPGYKMWSCANYMEDDYCFMSGTSQATPVVAGCAAVLLASGKVTGEGNEKVENLLKCMDASCVKLAGNGLGKGYIDLARGLGLTDNVSAPRRPEFRLNSGTYFETETEYVFLKPFEKGCTAYYSTDGKSVTYKNGILSSNASAYNPNVGIKITGAAAVTVNAILVKDSNQMASGNVSAKYSLRPKMRKLAVGPKNDVPSILPGKKLTMQALVIPDYTYNKKLEWSVSPDNAGVSVSSSGVVSATKNAAPGKYVVTAKSTDGSNVSNDYEIEVLKDLSAGDKITSISVKNNTVAILYDEDDAEGGEKEISSLLKELKITKKSGTVSNDAKDLYWTAENGSIVTVKEKTKLKIWNYGTTKLYGVAQDGSGKKITLTVHVVEKGLGITGPAVVTHNKSIQLKTVIPDKGSKGTIKWEIDSKDKAVTVTNGKVTAKSTAEAREYTVTASTTDGTDQKATYKIRVTNSNDSVDSITVKENGKALKAVKLFRVTNFYSASTNKSFPVICTTKSGLDSGNWEVSSSNPGLVRAERVENNVRVEATGNGTGSAVITVSSTDGTNKKATFKVNVTNPATKLFLSMTEGKSSYIVAAGTKVKLHAYLESDKGKIDSSAKKLEWISSNENILKVDKNGVVTGMSSYGEGAMITAKTTDGSNLTATFYLSSYDKVKKIGVYDYDNYWNLDSPQIAKNMTLYVNKSDVLYFVPYSTAGDGICSGEYTYQISKEGVSLLPFYNGLLICASKTGTYKLTVSSNDGSKAKATVTIKVKRW